MDIQSLALSKKNTSEEIAKVNQTITQIVTGGSVDLTEYAKKNGNISESFSANNVTVQGNIVPTGNGTQDIGSPTNRFGKIYVNEAMLSTNTLYIGDTPVMGTNQDTIVIKADLDQSITMKSSGTGTTKVISESGVELSTSGMNADVNLKATGSGANTNLSATNQVNLNAPNVNITGNTSLDSLTIRGNLTVNGSTTTVNSTVVQVADNIMELNKNEVGYGVTAGKAGIKIDRGDADAMLLVFDESDDNFKIGIDSNLKILSTQDYVDNKIATIPSGGNSINDSTTSSTTTYSSSKIDNTYVKQVVGKSLIADTEITRLSTVTNYDHTNVDNHMSNNNIHVTTTDKNNWNNKIDKVLNSVSGDIATLDANGNILDGSKKISDLVLNTITINGKTLNSNITLNKSDIGLGNVPNTDTTNASNITTGVLPSAQLPIASSTSIGGVKAGSNITIASDGTISSTVSGGNNINDTLTTSTTNTYSIDKLNSTYVKQVSGKQLSTEDYTTVEKTKLSNITGTNTGDETSSSVKTKLGSASSTTDGYLTLTDWNIFNNKADVSVIPSKTSQLTNDSNYVTPTNIKAGSNITVNVSGADVTIASTASGSGASINDNATQTSMTETYSVNKINSLITEVNNTNFTNANNAKTVTINAIGDTSLTTSNSFVELSNSLLAKKQNIVSALANKGIIATQSDDINSYATDINNIIQNSQIKNTKLNKTTGSTYQVVLTNPTTLQNVCTSVLEYQAGATGSVKYDCSFNNSDSTSFNTTTNQHIIFDGTMHQDNNIQSINMISEGTIDTYSVYTTTIDKTQFYKINNVAESTVSSNEVITVSGTYTPTLVQANSDISLVGIDRISNITWTATANNTSKLLLIYSLDSGITWKGYDTTNHVVLNITDITNLIEVKSKGVSISSSNTLTQTDLDNIRNGSPKIRFGYYFEKNNYTDTLINDEILLKVDMTGNDIFSTHYNVAFDGNKTITYTFTANGTYTIIYTDNN
jgi:hypothetical protein